jgi:hypothetical protein
MDVFKLAIHGTGYPLPGGYDDNWEFVYKDERSSVGTMLILQCLYQNLTDEN